MSEYQLELKQIVAFPRCRIYRQFIRTLMDDQSIRVGSGSGLFHYAVLCSFANFRTSYKRIGGISYTVYPGEWVSYLSDISKWFRKRFHHQALSILESLQNQHLISFTVLGCGKVIKYKIKGWQYFNIILDYNAPCQKETGFFFLPISKTSEIISSERCSEMDIILDLWMQTIYNDEQVEGSNAGPVVYLRNGTGSPLVGYSDLAARWGLSKATVGRILKKLEEKDYILLLAFSGRHGSAIYLRNYLSTMFQVSDVMIDKEEVAMSLNLKISASYNRSDNKNAGDAIDISADTRCVSNEEFCVSKLHIQIIVRKVLDVLSSQGISCGECAKIKCKLSPLSSGCREDLNAAALTQEKCYPEKAWFSVKQSLSAQVRGDQSPAKGFFMEVSCREANVSFLFKINLTRTPAVIQETIKEHDDKRRERR